MQILFYDKYYDTEDYESNMNRFKNELNQQFKEFDDNIKTYDANIGHGADSPSIIIDIFNNFGSKEVIVASLVSLFFLGDKINKNVNAWLEIINKISTLIQKNKPARIDAETAMLLAFKFVLDKKYNIEDISLSTQVIPFNKGSVSSDNILETTPDSLYIFSIKVKNKIFIIGIKSKGNIEFTHEYSSEWYEF